MGWSGELRHNCLATNTCFSKALGFNAFFVVVHHQLLVVLGLHLPH